MSVLDESKAKEIVKALSDEYSRKIVFSIITNSLPIEDIGNQHNIPISTCYRRAHELLHFRLIKPNRTIIREDGKKYVCYKSAIKGAAIRFDAGRLTVEVVPNVDPVARFDSPYLRSRKVPEKILPEKTSFTISSELPRVVPLIRA